MHAVVRQTSICCCCWWSATEKWWKIFVSEATVMWHTGCTTCKGDRSYDRGTSLNCAREPLRATGVTRDQTSNKAADWNLSNSRWRRGEQPLDEREVSSTYSFLYYRFKCLGKCEWDNAGRLQHCRPADAHVRHLRPLQSTSIQNFCIPGNLEDPRCVTLIQVHQFWAKGCVQEKKKKTKQKRLAGLCRLLPWLLVMMLLVY